jgi:pilus assembly protein CpaC
MSTLYRHRPLAVGLATALFILPSSWAVPTDAFELVAPEDTKDVSLVVGTGQLVRVDEEFSSLFVANPEVAVVEVRSPRLMYRTGVGVGATPLFAVDDNDNVPMSAHVKVTHNIDALNQGIRSMAPGQSVTASTVDQSLVLTGSVETAEQAANVLQVASQFVDDPTRVVNRLSVATPTQINLQVRIAEVSRNIDRRLGIQWNNLSLSTGSSTIRFRGGSGSAAGGAGAGGYSTSYGAIRGGFNIDVVLQALAEEGLVTIMAEPNLTARSGEPATFLAGGEYPYQTVSDNGTNTEFKNFGIGLNFTPTVVDGNRISLTVGTEVSELNFQNGSDVPSLRTRRAETTVDLASGQSFAIAGLMQNQSSQNASRMPALGTMPVIGALFRSNAFQRGQTELVIIVTPIIVNPTSGRRIATPIDTFVPPNDFEQILLGRFQGKPVQINRVQNSLGNRRLVGQSGFVFK